MAINPFFNANLYLAKNPDLVRAGLHTEDQLWNHYVQYGAQESKNVDTRAPNAWFDVNYYLAAYPDLIDGGITAATALDHFYNYGINEGRAFNPTISAAQFNAETYAANNADLREAFGIEDAADLTAADKATLLKHYLAYGYAENREGAGDIANEVEALNVFNVVDNDAADALVNNIGTIADDLFIVGEDVTAFDGQVIDGLGGTDTVQFDNTEVGVDVGEKNLLLRNIENIVVNNSFIDVDVANKVDSVKLTGEGALAFLNFNAAAVAGAEDVLNVSADADFAGLSVNGFETVNVTLGKNADEAVFELRADKSSGANQTVNLSGGKKDGTVDFAFANNYSTKLTDLAIDGSGLVAGLRKVGLYEQGENIANVVITGSATAKNDIEVVSGDEDQLFTVIGGANDDTFTASIAIETFTGGAGKDTFVFTAETSAVKLKEVDGKQVINGVDAITDFKKGDTLQLEDVETVAVLKLETGEDASLKTLEDWVARALADDDGANAFNFDGAAYVITGGGLDTDDLGLVKLVGVDAAKLTANDDGDFILA